MLESFDVNVLSREELKNVSGGTTFVCMCKRHAGAWIADYANLQSAQASIDTYCRGGGSCTSDIQ